MKAKSEELELASVKLANMEIEQGRMMDNNKILRDEREKVGREV